VVEAPTTAPPPLTGVAIATLNGETTGEPYEGVLVTMANVKVTTAAVNVEMKFGPVPRSSDEAIQGVVGFERRPSDATNGTDPVCYATMTGVWTYQPFEDTFRFSRGRRRAPRLQMERSLRTPLRATDFLGSPPIVSRGRLS
jgi:hypothetical protein